MVPFVEQSQIFVLHQLTLLNDIMLLGRLR